MSRRTATSYTCSCSSHVWFTSFFESHADLRMSPIAVSETAAGDCCEESRDVDIARHPDRRNRLFFVSKEMWDRPQTKTVSWFSFDSVMGVITARTRFVITMMRGSDRCQRRAPLRRYPSNVQGPSLIFRGAGSKLR